MITVHILLAGRAICGRPGVPCEWPEDEKWNSLNVKDAGVGAQLCVKCTTRREEMRKRK